MKSEKETIAPTKIRKGRGKERLYSEKKLSKSVSLTAATYEKLSVLATKNGLNFSELIERLGRALTVEDVRKLLSTNL